MVKQGPCFHCGVTSTPLWRNGPPEKPVLCNACGSRWRIKGTLANYTPLHVRAEAEVNEDHRISKVKTVSLKIGEQKLKKRKLRYENSVGKRFSSDYKPGFLESIDEEDTSNRSSSGSAVSNSETLAQFSSDFTGPAQSAVWETQVPSKKRSSVTRMMSSSVEKLIKDLHAILHEQKLSYACGSSDEDLLLESDVPMVSVEIGHGSVLIKHPSSFSSQEDSDASTLSFENKPCTSLSGSNGFNGGNVCYNGSEIVTKFTSEMMQQEPAKRNQFNHDRMQHLLTHNSPLCYIDLYDGKSSNQTQENEVESGSKLSSSKDLQSAKRPLQEQNLNIAVKETNEGRKKGLNKGRLFHLPTDSRHLMLESYHDEFSDQDLLLDVPLNGCFPEAELLLPSSSITSHQASTSCSSIHSAMIHH